MQLYIFSSLYKWKKFREIISIDFNRNPYALKDSQLKSN